ncbi:MAG: hypothetical protein JOY54_08595 [Acidobacteriaceae bacterium]|nr:hypothetical protein [Acidobacteriaceae bacterium]
MEQTRIPVAPSQESDAPLSETGSAVVDHFSLVHGGLIYRFEVALGVALPDRSGVTKRALLAILLTWLPLLVLSLAQGLAFGERVQVPFLYDFAANIRFLIALPLLILAEPIIDPKITHAARYFVTSRLIGAEELPKFEEQLQEITKLRDAILPTVLLILVAFLPSLWMKGTWQLGQALTNWHTVGSQSGNALSLAGWWHAFISLPLFRLILFRWLWLIVVWAFLLRRISRMGLRCIPSHPDRAAGLGFLTEVQSFFGLIAFSASVAVTGGLANAVAYRGQTLSDLKIQMITFCVLMVILLASPLLVLTPRLLKAKHEAVFDYGALGTTYAQSFDTKWIHGNPPQREELLGTPDLQSLADLANSFSVIDEMKAVLIDKKILLRLAIPVVLPMIPLLVIGAPADALIRVLKLLV